MQTAPRTPGYRHEALLYEGDAEFVTRTTPLVVDAVAAGSRALVAVGRPRLELLQESVGDAAHAVRWVDITGIGENPARIIPLWREFLAGTADDDAAAFFGIGQPVYAERGPAALAEAQRHEALLNIAFDGRADFTLVCPYDVAALPERVLEEAAHTHPVLTGEDGRHASAGFRGASIAGTSFDTRLQPPPRDAATTELDDPSQPTERFVHDSGTTLGLSTTRAQDLACAVVAVSGSVSGGGPLRMWRDSSTVFADLSGAATIEDPLAGREWPAPASGAARGLWVANQLCDLVQVRPSPSGTAVRMHMNAATA